MGIFRKLGLFIVLSILSAGAVHAVPVTYDFTATDFKSQSGTPIPNSSLSGSFTIDGAVVTDIDLVIGSHIYTVAEVGYQSDWVVGGVLNSENGIQWGTDDFWITGIYSSQPKFMGMVYSVNGVSDIFSTYSGTLTVRNTAVPAPGVLSLLGLGLLGLAATRRSKGAA